MMPPTAASGTPRRAANDPWWLQAILIAITVSFIGIFLVLPLFVVFFEAFRGGISVFLKSFQDRAALSAIRLTLFTAAICVPLNVIFGLCASWAIAKFEFKGKSLLITLIDLPYAVSPVISGLIFVLLFGLQGWFGPFLRANDIEIIFATPGIILATLFVTFPFVARELIPLMQEQGADEEQAALTLGASGLQTFWRVTLPNIKWALLYGVILCNARAIGEYGAVAVVAGSVRGRTNTIPLHIEILYNDYKTAAAFSIASLLALLGLVTLVIKTVLEWRQAQGPAPASESAEVLEAVK
jgi:sulfate/thiosulfate transport system permease protein